MVPAQTLPSILTRCGTRGQSNENPRSRFLLPSILAVRAKLAGASLTARRALSFTPAGGWVGAMPTRAQPRSAYHRTICSRRAPHPPHQSDESADAFFSFACCVSQPLREANLAEGICRCARRNTINCYHRFFVDPWDTRMKNCDLNHILNMHGFTKLHREPKVTSITAPHRPQKPPLNPGFFAVISPLSVAVL
ncbi:hypothetical protein EJB05_06900, partial [Eragrostis curvula]